MSQFSSETIIRLEQSLQKDPASQAFVTLAEAYRSQGRLLEAEQVSVAGLKSNPRLPSGWVALGKALKDQEKTDEALKAFEQAIQIAPENLLALQMAGECALELKNPKEALRFFKRLLFFNPNAEKAKRIVAKLESLTADEYGEEVFAMTKLSDLKTAPAAPPGIQPAVSTSSGVKSPSPPPADGGLMRFLSLVDAFIVRNDIERAGQMLEESQQEFGAHPQIDQRRQLLQRRKSSQMGLEIEEPTPLAPLASREEQIRRRKVALLQAALRRIEGLHDPAR